MGFATFVLKGLHPAAGFTWKLAKLAQAIKSMRSPLPRLEKVAVFALDVLKPELAMAYFCMSAVVGKIRADRWAKSTEKYLNIISPDHEITLEQVNTAFEVTKHNHAPKELLAKAGFLYLSEMLQADDAAKRDRYCTLVGNRFDHTTALRDFYGTDASGRLSDALGEYDHKTLTAAVRADVLVPLVNLAWDEVKNKTREDAVDLLLL